MFDKQLTSIKIKRILFSSFRLFEEIAINLISTHAKLANKFLHLLNWDEEPTAISSVYVIEFVMHERHRMGVC